MVTLLLQHLNWQVVTPTSSTTAPETPLQAESKDFVDSGRSQPLQLRDTLG